MVASVDWSQAEVGETVADYFHMLTLELSGQRYNKSVHRRTLQAKLMGRSEASIELKHRNVSAVLLELGCPYIAGYKPLPHYQRILMETVADRLATDIELDKAALSAVEQPAVTTITTAYQDILEPAPVLTIGEPKPADYSHQKFTAIRRDYLSREARNRSLGLAGEKLVTAYERHRLWRIGKNALSEKVEHVSKTQGDGLGYDVLSFEANGRERFIEVKTTSFGRETPFYVSRNEVSFSESFASQYILCRVFEFRKKPRMFELAGSIQYRVILDPVSYLARFA